MLAEDFPADVIKPEFVEMITGERTKGAARAHEPNVCVVVIALERNDEDDDGCCVAENNGANGVVLFADEVEQEEGVPVVSGTGELPSSLIIDVGVCEEIVISPTLEENDDDADDDDDVTFPFDGGMSIVLISLPNIKRKRFFCGVI